MLCMLDMESQDMITISLMGIIPVLQTGKLEFRESRTDTNPISSFELHPVLTMTSRNSFYLQMWQALPWLCWSFILSLQGQALIPGWIKQWALAISMSHTWLMKLAECLDFSFKESGHFEIFWIHSFISHYFLFLLFGKIFAFVHLCFWGQECLKRLLYFLLWVKNSFSISHHFLQPCGGGKRRHWVERTLSQPFLFLLEVSVSSSVKNDGTTR